MLPHGWLRSVLEPQTARFVLRASQGGLANVSLSSDLDYTGKAAEIVARRCRARAPLDLLDPALQLEAFETRAAAVLLTTSKVSVRFLQSLLGWRCYTRCEILSLRDLYTSTHPCHPHVYAVCRRSSRR